MKIINRELKNLIFHGIQVLASLHFQCATFKSKNIRLNSFYEEKKIKPCWTKQLLNMFKLWCELVIWCVKLVYCNLPYVSFCFIPFEAHIVESSLHPPWLAKLCYCSWTGKKVRRLTKVNFVPRKVNSGIKGKDRKGKSFQHVCTRRNS